MKKTRYVSSFAKSGGQLSLDVHASGRTDNKVDVEEVHALLLPCRGISAAARTAQVNKADNVPCPRADNRREEDGKL